MADKIIDYRVMTLPEYDEMKRQKAKSHNREPPPEYNHNHSCNCKDGNATGRPDPFNGINSLTASAVEGEKLAVKVIPKMTYNGTDYALIFTIPKSISVRGAVITNKQHLVIVLTNGERIDTGVIKIPISKVESNTLVQKADGLYVEKYDDSEVRATIDRNREEAENAVNTLKGNTVANFKALKTELKNDISELSNRHDSEISELTAQHNLDINNLQISISDNKTDIEDKLARAVEVIDIKQSELKISLENKIDETDNKIENYKSELELSISTNRSEVDSRIESVETQISNNETARDEQRENDLNEINSKIDANTTAISELDTKLDTSISEVNENINTAIARVLNDAPEDFDTLKEISDWIGDHAESAAEMNSQISENTSAIDNLNNTKVDAEYVKNAIETELLIEDLDLDFSSISLYFD